MYREGRNTKYARREIFQLFYSSLHPPLGLIYAEESLQRKMDKQRMDNTRIPLSVSRMDEETGNKVMKYVRPEQENASKPWLVENNS